MADQQSTVRLDKWLWAARFFKTRALASKACDLGRVHSNDVAAKPARDVKVGDRLRIVSEGGDFEIAVLGLSAMRGPAAAAQSLYAETSASTAARAKLKEERRLMPAWEQPVGRPSKKDRRDLNKARGRIIGF